MAFVRKVSGGEVWGEVGGTESREVEQGMEWYPVGIDCCHPQAHADEHSQDKGYLRSYREAKEEQRQYLSRESSREGEQAQGLRAATE